jgi:hypothetical protein
VSDGAASLHVPPAAQRRPDTPGLEMAGGDERLGGVEAAGREALHVGEVEAVASPPRRSAPADERVREPDADECRTDRLRRRVGGAEPSEIAREDLPVQARFVRQQRELLEKRGRHSAGRRAARADRRQEGQDEEQRETPERARRRQPARRSASCLIESKECCTVASHRFATAPPHQRPSAHRSVPSSPV